MTRLLACADLHIGAGADHRGDHLADQELVLDQIVDVARGGDCDALLLAGDVFHRPKATPAELHVFARFTRRLADAAIPTIALLGNAGHDQLGVDQPSALELFQSPWLRVSRTPELVKAAGDVAVCTLPSVPVSRLVATVGGGDRGEVNELAARLLVEAAAGLRAQVPDGWPCVLVAHWSISGAALPSGLPVADLHEPVLDGDALADLGFDAVVAGHIHRAQPLAGRCAFYCGSPMTHDFGEAGCEHGVWIFDLEELAGGSEDPPEFVPLADRRFVTVAVDVAAAAMDAGNSSLDETDLVAAAITEQLPLDDAVVRVTYAATEEQHRRVDHQALLGFLGEAGVHRVYGGLHWQPVRASRARVEGVDETLDPSEAVSLWVAANDVDAARADGLHRLTRDYLEGIAA